MLMHWKTMFDRRYCINSMKYALKLAKKALYFVTIRQSMPECTLSLLSACLIREHQAIQDGYHRSIRPRCFRKAYILKKDDRCVLV